jgi:hypothetical protein
MRQVKSSSCKDSCDEETAQCAAVFRAPPCLSWIVDVSRRDKVPIFTVEMLHADSEYPTTGKIPCEALQRFQDATGRESVRVSTEKPCAISGNANQMGVDRCQHLGSVKNSKFVRSFPDLFFQFLNQAFANAVLSCQQPSPHVRGTP